MDGKILHTSRLFDKRPKVREVRDKEDEWLLQESKKPSQRSTERERERAQKCKPRGSNRYWGCRRLHRTTIPRVQLDSLTVVKPERGARQPRLSRSRGREIDAHPPTVVWEHFTVNNCVTYLEKLARKSGVADSGDCERVEKEVRCRFWIVKGSRMERERSGFARIRFRIWRRVRHCFSFWHHCSLLPEVYNKWLSL